MAFLQNEKTQKFTAQVKKLEETGVVRSFKEIADAIDYNNTALSQVLSGTRNVPNDVFARFTERYNTEVGEFTTTKNADDYKDITIEALRSQITLLERQVQYMEEQIGELKSRNQGLAHHVNSSFVEVHKQAVVNRSYLKTILLVLERVLHNQEPRKSLDKIRSDVDTLLAETLAGAS